jgi:4-hydroxybenzoate polyprenyltransferase
MNMKNQFQYLLLALRPRQWIKNLFVFIPLLFGKQLFILPTLFATALAFIFFSLMASAVYLINDIYDRERDRRHRTKKLRPIASGKVTVRTATILAVALTLFSLIGAWLLSQGLAGVLLGYFLLNLLYSRMLKNVVIIDVFCIGVFFFLRIAAGTLVSGVPFSYWMIFMIFLLALFLGFIKRRQEIVILKRKPDEHRQVLSKYSQYFIDQMISILASSIVVVYMLYTVDQRTAAVFQTKHLILTIPFVYYGIFRYLYLIHQHQWGEDPTMVLYKDRMMQLNLAAWAFVCVAVIYFKF